MGERGQHREGPEWVGAGSYRAAGARTQGPGQGRGLQETGGGRKPTPTRSLRQRRAEGGRPGSRGGEGVPGPGCRVVPARTGAGPRLCHRRQEGRAGLGS